ncbi:ATP binding [Elasticomyces elasticus]|nr:ATP binding [Elasticomyces elasticus]KAK4898322.1 ATP binding [Elasticomyces elasticus]
MADLQHPAALSSPCPTEIDPPLILTWDYDPLGNQGDFARLWPLTDDAQLEFSQVVERMKDDSSFAPQARKLIRFEEASEGTSSRYTGCYRLNTSLVPSSGTWKIGSDASQADFLLTRNLNLAGVQGQHCTMQLDRSTSAFVLKAKYSVIVDGKRELRKPTEQQVLLAETGLSIGSLHYVYRSTDLSPATMNRQIEEFRRTLGWESCRTPSGYLSPPSTDAQSWQDFSIERPVNGGTFGKICCGRHCQTGVLVAVKRITVRNEHDLETVRREVDILGSLDHVTPDSAIYKDMPPLSRLGEIIIVMEPFMPINLGQVEPATLENLLFPLTIVRDLLAGLDDIHGKDIMHRDLKPANICVVPHPPKAVIVDFGNAMRGCSSRDHNVGTIPYLAPEIMALKHGRTSKSFDKSADVWSLGMTLAETILRAQITEVWNVDGINKTEYDIMIPHLVAPHEQSHRKRVPDELCETLAVVARMLAWTAYDRPTCAEILPGAEAILEAQLSAPKTPCSPQQPPLKKQKV